MPHYRNANEHWATVCQRLGFGYVDPRGPRQAVIAGIRSTRVLITEAMHGAIVADALGIPWIAIRTRGAGTLEFKWRDWCGSLGLSHRAHAVVPIFSTTASTRLRLKVSIAAAQLWWISKTAEPQMSDEGVRQEKLAELHERLTSQTRPE